MGLQQAEKGVRVLAEVGNDCSTPAENRGQGLLPDHRSGRGSEGPPAALSAIAPFAGRPPRPAPDSLSGPLSDTSCRRPTPPLPSRKLSQTAQRLPGCLRRACAETLMQWCVSQIGNAVQARNDIRFGYSSQKKEEIKG
jgi:hypothetical protein